MKSTQLTDAINSHISRNIAMYTPGNIFTFKHFARKTAKFFTLADRNPLLVADSYPIISAYTKINKLLALRGLALRSHKLRRFEVVSASDTYRKVSRMRKRAACTNTAANTLEIGARLYASTWTPLAPDEIERVSGHIYTRISTSSYAKA